MNPATTQPLIVADAAVTGGLPSWLQVRASADAVELLIIGQIGKSWWDESGVDEKAFRDQLALIPVGTRVTVGINSQGGNVQAGLGIYNALVARRAKGRVVTRCDGYAASIASVILCAGDEVICPETGAVMIHDPWTTAQGNADEMERARQMLEANAGVMVAAYAQRSGKSAAEIRKAMKAETWFTGQTAKDWGLVDEVTSGDADLETIAAAFDASRHPHAPRHVVEVWNSAGRRPDANDSNTNPMNRTLILALLAKHGVKLAGDANDAAILAALTKLVDDGKVDAAERDRLTNAPPANTPAPPAQPAPAAVATPPAQPAPQAAGPVAPPQPDTALAARIAALEAENQRMRQADITRQIDGAISEGRIPALQRDRWIQLASTDASVIQLVTSMPPNLPGVAPVAEIEVTSTSINDLVGHFGRLCNEASASFLRGNSVSPGVLAANANQAGRFYDRHRSRLLEVLGAVTVPANLQRNVILQEVMTALARKLLPLTAFSTVFRDVPLEGTNVVTVPYFPLVTDASTDFNSANGYVMGDSTQQEKPVTINKRKYQPISVFSSELSRQPAINLGQIAVQKADKLGYDVFLDVLSVVTAANYGAASFTGAANTFDSADIADLKGVADTANWPDIGRSLIVKSAYDVNLLKDTGVKAAYAFGSAEPIRVGTVPSIFGFRYFVAENIPANAQNLVGFISMPSAILFASAPIVPDAEVRGQLGAYQIVTHPETGVTMEYRRWGNADFDQRREVIEVNYGFAVGEAAALKRAVSA